MVGDERAGSMAGVPRVGNEEGLDWWESSNAVSSGVSLD